MNEELEANTNLSHYRIVSKVGAGGMGEIYLASDTRLRRAVAIKILPANLTQDAARRFAVSGFAAARRSASIKFNVK